VTSAAVVTSAGTGWKTSAQLHVLFSYIMTTSAVYCFRCGLPLAVCLSQTYRLTDWHTVTYCK
jgi:hypothetical protein